MNIVGVPLQFIKIDQENVIAMEISVFFSAVHACHLNFSAENLDFGFDSQNFSF